MFRFTETSGTEYNARTADNDEAWAKEQAWAKTESGLKARAPPEDQAAGERAKAQAELPVRGVASGRRQEHRWSA